MRGGAARLGRPAALQRPHSHMVPGPARTSRRRGLRLLIGQEPRKVAPLAALLLWRSAAATEVIRACDQRRRSRFDGHGGFLTGACMDITPALGLVLPPHLRPVYTPNSLSAGPRPRLPTPAPKLLLCRLPQALPPR